MTTSWKTLLAVLSCALFAVACPDDDKPSNSDSHTRDAGADDDQHDDDDDAAGRGSAGSKSEAGKGGSGSSSNAGSGGKGGAGSGSNSNAGSGGKGGSNAGGAGGAGGSKDEGPSADRFFLPTTEPDNTLTPSIVIDADGGMHMLYGAHAIGSAYYAYCPKGCKGAEDMKVAKLPTDGTAHAMLAVNAKGQPRALLSTLVNLYYAECNEECTDDSHWTISKIADLAGDRDVTGNAFALDKDGHPRFIMHTYLAYLGIGQKTPETWFAHCDDACSDASSWTFDSIATEIWYGSELRYDDKGTAHLLTGIVTSEMDKATYKLAAYLECPSDCSSTDNWNGIGLGTLFENDIEEVKPSFAFALTKDAQPRVVALIKDEMDKRRLVYGECDSDCQHDNWSFFGVSDLDKLGSGLDIALDAQDRPRFVFTLDHNIGMHYCEADHCTEDASLWGLTPIELSTDIPPDNIILWPNCTVDAWIVHDPTIALTSDGAVRVGYQATDLSGGWTNSDPTQPACVAGKDMVLSRMSMLASYK